MDEKTSATTDVGALMAVQAAEIAQLKQVVSELKELVASYKQMHDESLGCFDDSDPIFTTVPFPPVLTAVSPTSGPTNAHTNLSLTGSGFTGATGVTIGGVEAQFIVNSDTSITAVAPGGAPGSDVVKVVNDDGASEATTVTFAYVAPAD